MIKGIGSGTSSEIYEGEPVKRRGIFERAPSSGVWSIVYFDQFGKRRREKAGRAEHCDYKHRCSGPCAAGRAGQAPRNVVLTTFRSVHGLISNAGALPQAPPTYRILFSALPANPRPGSLQ